MTAPKFQEGDTIRSEITGQILQVFAVTADNEYVLGHPQWSDTVEADLVDAMYVKAGA